MKSLCKIIILALMLGSLLAGCSCAKKAGEQPAAVPSASAAPSAAAAENSAAPEENKAGSTPAPTLAPSVNKEVAIDKSAPKVFWCIDAEGSMNTAYHLDGCSGLEGKKAQEVSWEMVKSIGLRQCPVCNPPRYEGYVD